jgi:hypothetical protein
MDYVLCSGSGYTVEADSSMSYAIGVNRVGEDDGYVYRALHLLIT